MHPKLSFFKLKVKLSAKIVWWVLRQWRYTLLAIVVAFLFFELIYWLFNFNTFTIVVGSGNLNLVEKTRFIFDSLFSLGSTNGTYTATLMLLVSTLQGINIAVLTYTIRHQQKLDTAILGGGSFVSLLAIIGLGCPSCGTSLATPIVAIFVSGSTVAISESITRISLPIALAVGIYGLYSIGLKAATARAQSDSITK